MSEVSEAEKKAVETFDAQWDPKGGIDHVTLYYKGKKVKEIKR